MILAIDSATVTGWAAGPAGSSPPDLKWGARDFSGRQGNGEVISKFRHWLNQLCYELKPKIITFESPYIPYPGKNRSGPPMNAITLRRLMTLAGIVEATAWELRIECREANTGEISKFFTGTSRHGGRANKKAATIEMCRAYGWNVENDNEADALALWAMTEAIMDPRASSARGDGRLFIPRNESAPRTATRGAQNRKDEGKSSDDRQTEFI